MSCGCTTNSTQTFCENTPIADPKDCQDVQHNNNVLYEMHKAICNLADLKVWSDEQVITLTSTGVTLTVPLPKTYDTITRVEVDINGMYQGSNFATLSGDTLTIPVTDTGCIIDIRYMSCDTIKNIINL